jgi:lipopolysaccharide/colanic/teichoic acid biosynthesis glycosyltransferase
MFRRVLDVTLAGAALAASAPLLAVVSAAIRLESPGPVLFRQIRVGRHRRAIETLKLRTMVVDAHRQGLQITAGHDPRVTGVGRFLRKTKLDELPQLWNVIRGDMSVVGPRPEVPKYVESYRPEWEKLFSVRPGLTDLASLAFRDEERMLAHARDHERAYREVIMPLKLGLAMEGVERSSLLHDLGIIVRTMIAIVRGQDARQDMIRAEVQRRIELLNESTEVA